MSDTVFAHRFFPTVSNSFALSKANRLTTADEGSDFEASDLNPDALPLPATVSDLIGQIQQLVVVFVEAEDREPGPQDTEFWSAVNTLIERFQQGYRPSGDGPNAGAV